MHKPKSHTVALFPILIALNKFKEHGIEGFTGTSEAQKYLLSLQPEALGVTLPPEQIQSFIADSAPELNGILRDHGFSIQLDESEDFDLGVVSILDLVAKWQGKASPTVVKYNNTVYPAAKVTAGASITPLHPHTVDEKDLLMIRPESTSGLIVFIEKDTPPRAGLDLFQHVYTQAQSLVRNEIGCDATIPFVTIDDQPDISFVTGLSATNTNLVINQALQQNKLSINLDGIHAESAVALGAKRSISAPRNQVVIDTPFTLWVARANPEHKYFPLFAAYVDPTNWIEKKINI